MRFNGMIRRAGIALCAGGVIVGTLAGTADASPDAGRIGPGQTNNPHGVWCVQAAIDASPVNVHVAEDGVYGPQTEAAIKAFQRHYLLTADGIVGESTGSMIWQWDDYSDYCYTYVPTP